MKSLEKRKLIIGARDSKLSLLQVDIVVKKIKAVYPNLDIEITGRKTKGDRLLQKPLVEFGGKGLFVAEFEEALLHYEIDLAIHSAKDLPNELAEGLDILAVTEREDARDVLVSLQETTKIKKVGTGSLRRSCQLEKLFPDMKCENIRGNVETRLEKMENGEYDAVILAAAGLKRLGLTENTAYRYRYFSTEEIIPAAGQGIIAVEGRKGDVEIQDILQAVQEENAYRCLMEERRILKEMNADCHSPIGIYTTISDGTFNTRIFKDD